MKNIIQTNKVHKNWLIAQGTGPVLTTAVHAGRHIRNELVPYLNDDHNLARREEDPLTDIIASVGDHVFISYNSRFEVDLNRSPDLALSSNKKDTWGIPIWKASPPKALIEDSLSQHTRFYCLMKNWIEEMIELHGRVLLLDIHSYNHRRAGPGAAASDPEKNPDIDLGMTTLDKTRFGDLAKQFLSSLRAQRCRGEYLDVRENVRYPDGGYWPEWVYENYSENVCTITLEYKKFYIDEWTEKADMIVVEELRAGLANAISAVRGGL